MSDVLRARALLIAALAAAIGLAAALFASDGAGRVLAPAPVSMPHQRAGLECQSCHEAESTALACTGCHGAQRSARAGHQRLAARGELGCNSCHRAHGAEGVRTDEQGRLFHFTGRGEWAHGTGLLAPSSALPFVAGERCGACHDLERESDPAAHCFSGASPNLCFDEHAGPSRPGRSALAEAARSLAQSGVSDQRSKPWARIAWQLGTAFGFGLVALFVVRWRGRKQVASARPETPAGGARRRLPVIDSARCLGCAACVEACPHDVLEVSRHVALVARPDACCGLSLCAERCPNGSLQLVLGEPQSNLPALSAELESKSQPGLFLAGDVTGQALIRTAVQQGAAAADAVARSLGRQELRGDGIHDLAIIGAGPAGLSAALQAKKLGLNAVVLEQGRVAESIQSFSRDKIVLDSQASADDLPLWVGECHKDELVRRWLRTVRAQKLDLREHARVASWRKLADKSCFELRFADSAAPLLARRVLLAVGRRGSPRKLEVPLAAAAQSRVHYSLSDARSFAGRRVVIVGLGDSAMEAAVALAKQNGTRIDVVYRGSEHRRGKRRNIAEIRRLCNAGRIAVHWSSEVARVGLDSIVVAADGAERELAYDALFVLIGGAASDALLPSAAR